MQTVVSCVLILEERLCEHCISQVAFYYCTRAITMRKCRSIMKFHLRMEEVEVTKEITL